MIPSVREIGGNERVEQECGGDLVGTFPEAIRDFFAENARASQAFVNEAGTREKWFREHHWWPFAQLCLDGRVQDVAEALGLPVGVLEIFRSGGARQKLVWGFSRRLLDSVRKASNATGYTPEGMSAMNLATVHYSASCPRPDQKQSCAGWEHRTDLALEYQARQSAQFNAAFPGDRSSRLLSFPALIDTDLDAIAVNGPDGSLSILELLNEPSMQNGNRLDYLVHSLRRIFPMTWPVLSLFPESHRATFHSELAELLSCNFERARRTRESGRAPDLLDHHETIVLVGRHADVMVGNNKMCIVDDVNGDLPNDFVLALQYAARNVLRNAFEMGTVRPVIPVVVNIPHDGEDDRALTLQYGAILTHDLHDLVDERRKQIVDWLRHALPTHMRADLKMCRWFEQFPDFVRIVSSTSLRSSRLYVPFDSRAVLLP